MGLHPLEFLVDTGASVNLIDPAIYRSLSDELCTPLAGTDMVLHGADGKKLKVFGCTSLTFQVDEVEYTTNMVVATLGGLQAILGMKFLEEHQSRIDLGQGTLICGDCCHTLSHVVPQPQRTRVRLAQKVRLEARTATRVLGVLEDPSTVEGDALVEQDPWVWEETGVMLPRTLVRAGETDLVEFVMLHWGKEPLELLARTPVAVVQQVTPLERQVGQPF